MGLTTLCYIEKDECYLMLHRIMKKIDINKDKWIGVGGHFEDGESPEECLLREVREETGYTLTSWRYRGIVTFVYGEDVVEYMSLYTADGFEGTPIPCDEGELEWVEKEKISDLELWTGDKIFFRLLEEERKFFSLKLVYDRKDTLLYAALDGKPMELFDVRDTDGSPSGIVQERGVVHREGLLHSTVHIWIVRRKESGGYEVLLQKRSAQKDSNPGCYDISSAGHVEAGKDYLESALREMKEELGIDAQPEDLQEVGFHRGSFEAVFHGKPFRDEELSMVYLYRKEISISELTLQESEVESVRWMDYEECRRNIENGTLENCIYLDEFDMVGVALVLEAEE